MLQNQPASFSLSLDWRLQAHCAFRLDCPGLHGGQVDTSPLG